MGESIVFGGNGGGLVYPRLEADPKQRFDVAPPPRHDPVAASSEDAQPPTDAETRLDEDTNEGEN